MKIAVADNQQLKFDKPLIDHWIKRGHEVRYEMGASEHLFQWCDLYYVNFWDNNIHYLWNWHKEHPEVKKPKIACRALDWEVWCGLVRSNELIDWVDYPICIADHIKEKLEAEADFKGRLTLIKPGIDLSKWTISQSSELDTYKILIPCNEIDWYLKHVIEGLKIFAELTNFGEDITYQLHVRGKFKEPEYMQLIIRDYVEKAGIKDLVVFDQDFIEDMNSYYGQFDCVLNPTMKEAFSFVTAETAAKDIKQVLNWWYGAEKIWPKEWLYLTPGQAIEMIKSINRYPAREYVQKWYNLDRMLSEFDNLLGT